MSPMKSACHGLKSFRITISTLLLVATALFLIITYCVVKGTLHNFTARAYNRAQMIENAMNASIADANQIMYGLAMVLTQEPIKAGNKHISTLLGSFDSKLSRYKSIPFSCFRLLDPSATVVALTSIATDLFIPQKNVRDHDLLSRARTNPFELQVGSIRVSKRFKEIIIPLCLAFNNAGGEYAGTLCSGLLVDKLNDQLNLDCSSEHVAKITLLNKENYVKMGHYKADDIFTIKNIPTLFKYVFQNKNLTAYLPLNNYPIVVEVEAKIYYFVKELSITILLCFSYFILFLAFTYYLFGVYEKFYRKPLYIIQKKIHALSNNPDDFTLDYFCINTLSNALDNIAEQFNSFQIKSMQEAHAYTAMGLRNNILDLILTERHYTPPEKGAKINFSSLYLTQLKNLVHEEKTTTNLFEFLKDTKKYCCAHYEELDVSIIVQKKDSKDFTYYRAALLETIFHIFTIIVQAKNFDTTEKPILLKGNFTSQSSFPTISIEAPICTPFLNPSQEGLTSINEHTGLLGIYLLAKENNLFFHIEQTNQTICFLLEPINNKQLDRINSGI